MRCVNDVAHPLQELVDLYLLRCEVEGKSPQTVRAYRETLGGEKRRQNCAFPAGSLQFLKLRADQLMQAGRASFPQGGATSAAGASHAKVRNSRSISRESFQLISP